MSLKAKLEAVIYAAEEPVTLAQLAALFTAEALEYKAARDAAAAAAIEPETLANRTLPLLDEGFAYLGLEQAPASFTSRPDAGQDAAPIAEHGEAAATEAGSAAGPLPAPAPDALITAEPTAEAAQVEISSTPEPSQPAESPADAESQLKREARQRDREVRAILQELIGELIASSASDDRGVEIREIAGGYRMATKPECHDAVRLFVRSLKPPLKLSLQALETLAVVAYKQPVTAPEVSEIRGVESAGTLGSLLSRKLIATAGRKQVIGRPILYKTTREFLLRFGLKDVSELPSMEEFEKMAAIELDERATADEDAAVAVEVSEDAAEEAIELGREPVDNESALDSPADPAGKDLEHSAAEAASDSSQSTETAETEASSHGQ
jgi:segregation and condensation protein B